MAYEPNLEAGAIVCAHVADGSAPILYAARSTPVDTADSGWQFTCNKLNHGSDSEAQIWSVAEVLAAEPSLHDFVDMPEGTKMARTSVASPWSQVRQV
jgi:hypothetical protein